MAQNGRSSSESVVYCISRGGSQRSCSSSLQRATDVCTATRHCPRRRRAAAPRSLRTHEHVRTGSTELPVHNPTLQHPHRAPLPASGCTLRWCGYSIRICDTYSDAQVCTCAARTENQYASASARPTPPSSTPPHAGARRSLVATRGPTPVIRHAPSSPAPASRCVQLKFFLPVFAHPIPAPASAHAHTHTRRDTARAHTSPRVVPHH